MTQVNTLPIGFFDSGIGGLTILRETLQILPNEHYIYVGDTRHVPYGTKTPEQIKKLSTIIAKSLLKYPVKALVIACNTVSAVALSEIQRLAGDIPVIGVIDPTVDYAMNTPSSGTIGVIATQTTIDSHVYEEKIRLRTNGRRRVVSTATSLFVPLIEKDPHQEAHIQETIRISLANLKTDKSLTLLILGCTHYPMIKDHIASFFGDQVTIIDSSIPTAQTLKKILETRGLLANSTTSINVYFTAPDPVRSIQITKEYLKDYVVTLEPMIIPDEDYR